ncbi:MAG: glycosyltransferase [Burkholderiaceae bacterium]
MRSFPDHWFGPLASRTKAGRNQTECKKPPTDIPGDLAVQVRPVHPGPVPLRAGLIVTLLVAIFLNLGLWWALNPGITSPDSTGQVSGFAYNAFGRWDSPIKQKYPDASRIESDLAMLAKSTRRIRTYSSSELPTLPAVAKRYGIRVTAGVWLDKRQENNRLEIAAGIKAAAQHPNIERLVVGNETLLHGLLTVDQLARQLDYVRARVSVPVSTAEPWHVWLKNPKLADHVDYILVHLLPYWEGVPHGVAVEYALRRYREMQQRFPDKTIVIGEIGWPSNGDRFKHAHASELAQAQFIRDFLAAADGKNLDYFLMEAIDQPWKRATEGRVGSYWGVMDAYRNNKFAFSGPLNADLYWVQKALLASLLGVIAIALLLRRVSHMCLASKVFLGVLVQSCASLTVWLLAVPFQYYMRWFDWLALAVLVPTLFLMLLIVMANGIEFAEMFWRGNLRRRFAAKPLPADVAHPMVSIHLACSNEQPDMVIATIKSLENLDYQNYEVIVVDNNTADKALWQPVQAYMSGLDERFRFFHLPKWPGYKAGALNYALSKTSGNAQIIGVVDADYMVNPNWLKSLVGGFSEPGVAVVQAPQAHRGWSDQVFRGMMNWEFDGFFRVGMHHRNERNAIIQHGTMTLISADALRSSGNWSEDCICEDAELGLRLMKAGWQTVYVDEVMGRGLTADTFAAFRKQRHRWAQGAMQIMRAHAGPLFIGGHQPEEPGLSAGQRYHFVAGWMSWIGDALHLVFAVAAMFWTVGILAAPHLFSLPILLFMLPVFGFFVCRVFLGPILFFRQVQCRLRDVIGASLAGMAVSHGIARGIFAGLMTRRAVFQITEKAGGGKVRKPRSKLADIFGQAREETFLFAGLMVCLIGIGLTRESQHIESMTWMALLALQSVPYLAAIICAGLSGLPENLGKRWQKNAGHHSRQPGVGLISGEGGELPHANKVRHGHQAGAARVSSL